LKPPKSQTFIRPRAIAPSLFDETCLKWEMALLEFKVKDDRTHLQGKPPILKSNARKFIANIKTVFSPPYPLSNSVTISTRFTENQFSRQGFLFCC
jgi:hypothetical protein